MINKPILSICIPTYNRWKILCETLDSIVCQFNEKNTSDKIEIIISNNNSPDNTEKLLKPYLNKYNNIRYFKNEKNLWSAINVIKVTEYAKGEYLWLLSDDDCTTQFSLEYILEIIEETKFDIMFGKFLVYEGKKISDFNQKFLGYNKFDSIQDFSEFIWHKENIERNVFGSWFSYYSIYFIKKDFFNTARLKVNKEILKSHYFPHAYIIFPNIANRIIVLSENTFTLGMGHPNSRKPSRKVYKDYREIFWFLKKYSNINKNFLKMANICVKKFLIICVILYFVYTFHLNNNTLYKKLLKTYKEWRFFGRLKKYLEKI